MWNESRVQQRFRASRVKDPRGAHVVDEYRRLCVLLPDPITSLASNFLATLPYRNLLTFDTLFRLSLNAIAMAETEEAPVVNKNKRHRKEKRMSPDKLKAKTPVLTLNASLAWDTDDIDQ